MMILGISMTIFGNQMQFLLLRLIFELFHVCSNDISIILIPKMTLLSVMTYHQPVACYPARALRALGLLLADGAPTVGGGKTF